MPETSFIQLHRLSKRFGGVTALDEVSFDIRRGEVHAVVGENGAGKSTLMKLLAGVYEPDAGEIKIESQPARLKNPRDARRQGVSIVFQELNLFPHRTVTANVFANREPTNRWGGLRRNQMRDATRQALSELGVNLSPDALVGSLSIGEKQFVEIARTLEEKARIVILDEPNSALGETESQRLFEIIPRLRGRGITLIYISHRLEEVFAIADRITVLRDGQYQGTYETRDTTIPKIITVMIGRPAENLFPQKKADASQGPVTLQVRELCRKPRLGPICFSARAGEVVGFAGLEGAGVNELFRVLFGLDEMTSGQIVVRDEPQESTGPSAAMRRGCAMIPENRREQGLMMDWSIARNTTLLILDKLLNRLGLIDKNQVRSTTGSLIQRLGISTNQQETKVVNLSGGNQQKVLLAKWLAPGPSILILDNPTRGVDVGAKMEIYALCHQLAGQGMTILLASSETEEILGLADRILVLAKGKVIHEFQRDEVSKGELMHAMSGTAVVTEEKS